MDERYLDPSFTTNPNDPVMQRSKRITSTVQNVYLATVVFAIVSFLFAFIDAAWLTHFGVSNKNHAAIGMGAVSIVLFLVLLILLAVAIWKRKYVTSKLKTSLFHLFNSTKSGNSVTVLQPEHVHQYQKAPPPASAPPPSPSPPPTLPPISASGGDMSGGDFDFM